MLIKLIALQKRSCGWTTISETLCYMRPYFVVFMKK